MNVLFESVGLVGNRTDASLGISGVAFVHFSFGYDCNLAVTGRFERETESRRSAADNQKIGLHNFVRLLKTKAKLAKKFVTSHP